MTQSELTALIQNAQAGDSQAQEALIRDIQNRVYYHCKKMLKNESDAQDAAQDVLIAVLTSLDKLREPAAFYGWVNGITANRCRHLLTQGVREWQMPEDEDGGSMLDDLEDLDQQVVPEAVLDNKETQRLMMEIIDALSPDQRMCVLFYYYDEMSVKEIAQAMGTSEGTVKSRLNYARKSIKAGVEELEKRGTKLYGIAPLPLLLLFLRMEAAQSVMSAAQSTRVISAVLSAAQAGKLGAGAAGAAGSTASVGTAGTVGSTASAGTAGTAGSTASVGTAGTAGSTASVGTAGTVGSTVSTGAATAGAAGTAAGTVAAGTAAKTGVALGVKIVAGILAVILAAGGGFAAAHLITRDEQPPEEEPPVEIEERLPEPAEDEETLPEEPPEPEGPSPELLELLNGIVYYGDPLQCRLTPEQAAAFARVIRQEIDGLSARAASPGGGSANITTCVALFDVGDGTPALFFGGGVKPSWMNLDNGNVYWDNVGTLGIWQYQDGAAVPYAPEGQEPGGYWGQLLLLREGNLFIGGPQGSDGSQYDGGVYPLTGGIIPTVPRTSAGYEPIDLLDDPYNPRYQIDGVEVAEEAFQAWQNQWESQTVLCGHYWDGGVGGTFSGMGDAAAAADALERYAASGNRQEPAEPSQGNFSQEEPVQDAFVPVSAPAYAPVYAQQVRELLASGPANCKFDLIYIDNDEIPELVVSYPDTMDFFPRVNLYTVIDGTELCLLRENLTAGLRGSGMFYYPKQNAVRLDTSDLRDNRWVPISPYYQISSEHQLERVEEAPEVSVAQQPLEGTQTGAQILSVLEP